MANSKISGLTSASTPLAGIETLPIVQSGATKQVSIANLTVGRAVNTAGGTFTDNQIQGTAAKGINFTSNTPAAGMTSRLLNWYEEGTWTPTDASGAGLSLTVLSATYRRIGNVVFFTFFGQYPVTVNASQAVIGGFPFTSVAYSPCPINTASVADAMCRIGSGANTGSLITQLDVAITNAQVSNSYLIFSGFYPV